MDLAYIEARATELAEELSTTTSKGQAEMLAWQLQGLKDLATIKQVISSTPQAAIPTQVGVFCTSRSKSGDERCSLPMGHSGWHQTGDLATLSWPNEGVNL